MVVLPVYHNRLMLKLSLKLAIAWIPFQWNACWAQDLTPALENIAKKLNPTHLEFLRSPLPPLGFITVEGISFEKPIDCQASEFALIEQKLGMEFLSKNHLSLIVFAHQLTKSHRLHYKSQLISLLKSWNRPAEKELIATLSRSRDPQDAAFEVADRGRLNFARQLRLSGPSVETELKALINSAPSCLSKINLSFSEQVRRRVTQLNSQFILTKIRLSKNRQPASEADFKKWLPSKQSVDGWQNPLKWVTRKDSSGIMKAGILSDGPSQRTTQDDLFFEY